MPVTTTTTVTTTTVRKVKRPKPQPRLVKRVRTVTLRTHAAKGAKVEVRRADAALPVQTTVRTSTIRSLPAGREVLVLPASRVRVLPGPKA